MALVPGSRLGIYEIAHPLGAGGMGEVYRARDTSLGRAVAIKILPATLAGDAEREGRFTREAQVLAALNHPHIAAIYGLEQAEGTRFLVLELVDGETLAEKLKAQGTQGLAVDEAVTIARQIAEALQAAHDKGIIHRDLKPANIALTAEGQVKVLDFGLARFTGATDGSPDSVGPTVSQSPTLTVAATQAGMILGTAAYMSPEQAKGRTADKRSDIWAFGCVLFEMLAGRRPFDPSTFRHAQGRHEHGRATTGSGSPRASSRGDGDDISDTLAAILRGDPDWKLLPADLPVSLRTLVEGCLKKDRAQRIGDIAVAQFLLQQPAIPAPSGPMAAAAAPGLRRWKAAAAVLALAAIAAVAAAAYAVANRPEPELARFLIMPPDKGAFVTGGRTGSSVAISPDGRYAEPGVLQFVRESTLKEIFYRDSVQLGSVWAVDIHAAGRGFAVGEPRRPFDRSWVIAGHPAIGVRQFAATRDGQRFLVPANPRVSSFTETTSEPVVVVTNWAAALPR